MQREARVGSRGWGVGGLRGLKPPPPSKLMRCVTHFDQNTSLILSEVPLNFMKNEHAKTSLNESDIIEHEARQISRPETNASRLLARSICKLAKIWQL